MIWPSTRTGVLGNQSTHRLRSPHIVWQVSIVLHNNKMSSHQSRVDDGEFSSYKSIVVVGPVVSEIINPKRLFMKSAYNALRDGSNLLLLLPSLFLLAVSLLLLWHILSCTR